MEGPKSGLRDGDHVVQIIVRLDGKSPQRKHGMDKYGFTTKHLKCSLYSTLTLSAWLRQMWPLQIYNKLTYMCSNCTLHYTAFWFSIAVCWKYFWSLKNCLIGTIVFQFQWYGVFAKMSKNLNFRGYLWNFSNLETLVSAKDVENFELLLASVLKIRIFKWRNGVSINFHWDQFLPNWKIQNSARFKSNFMHP